MRTFKLILVIFVSFLLGFAACANEEARLISTTCGALKRYFGLSKDDHIKCLGDADYRQSLVSVQDTQWSQSISDGHNRKRMIMLPKKRRDTFTRVSQITELPLKQAVNFSRSAAAQYVAERYVIAGVL